MKLIKWLVSKVIIPLVLSIGIAYGVLYFISAKTDFNNPVISFLFAKPYEVTLAGTGSMYKTLYWDKNEGGPEDYEEALSQNNERVVPHMFPHLVLNYQNFHFEKPDIGFGDLVSFPGKDPETSEPVSFIKRVIGLPGDKIELRDGYVIRNGSKLFEPYTLKPRSTFGGDSVLECKEITIPENQYFVLGDNRKLSFDSRFNLGFVKGNTIDSVLPFDRQDKLKTYFRSGSEENALSKEVLNTQTFLGFVNKLRSEQNLKPLSENSLLSTSAANRGGFMLTNDNFEIKDPSGNAYFESEMAKVGYENPLIAEFLVQGYFDAEELFALRLESPDFKNLLLEKAYSDIGVGVVSKDVHDCPTQVVVIHLGGYVPAEYSGDAIESWRDSVQSLDELLDNWEDAKGNELYNQDKLDDVLNKISEAKGIAQRILAKMEGRLWLTTSDEIIMARYEDLIEEINDLLKELDQEAQKNLQN